MQGACFTKSFIAGYYHPVQLIYPSLHAQIYQCLIINQYSLFKATM